jgi:predicted TIM-barrel fold metal-dependent hydrolase
MEISDIGMVSADAHVNEPRDLWANNLPKSMREQAMRGIRSTSDGGWTLILDGAHIGKAGTSEAERLEVLKPEVRLEVMAQEGIAAECVFPAIGLYVWMLDDPEGGRISCRIYNEFIHESLASRSPRFCCAGLVPTWRIEDAVAEIQFIHELGLGAVMLPTVSAPAYNHRDWEPMWEAIEATGLPIVMHQGTGHDMIWDRGPGASVANLVATQSMAPRVATMLATSGVLANHPKLHFVFVEYNAGWLGWIMDTVDYYTESFARYDLAERHDDKSGSWIYPELPEPPSHYLRRQVHATFQKDVIGLRNLDFTGAAAVMWGSDFPHEEGTYPHSRETVDELAAGLDPDAARQVFRDNAAAIFKFDEAVLSAPL